MPLRLEVSAIKVVGSTVVERHQKEGGTQQGFEIHKLSLALLGPGEGDICRKQPPHVAVAAAASGAQAWNLAIRPNRD